MSQERLARGSVTPTNQTPMNSGWFKQGINMVQAIEVDFLPVGAGEHSGDAIAVRWKEDDQIKVLIYDGGTGDYGKALVAHVREHFQTDTVDYVVNSHPDNDHAGGLAFVLEELKVSELWMHRPWERSADIRGYFHDGRITDESLAKRLQQKMSAAYALEKIALQRNIPIREPFAGSQIGIFTVLSPTEERYVHKLIPQFEKSPELKEETSALESFKDTAKAVLSYIADFWDKEYLPDTVTTSAENESSAILYASTPYGGYLLTGDTGIQSLRAAHEYASSVSINVASDLKFAQIPHHGGRHNVSTETLNLLMGSPLADRGEVNNRIAFVSAAEKAPKHPKRVVTNAFIRRGFEVGQTKGKTINYGQAFPARPNWVAIDPVPFYDQVEV